MADLRPTLGYMERHSTQEPLLDYDTAAPVLRCSARMVRKLVETRQLDSVKIGRLVRIEPAALQRYVESHRRAAQ
jgi:excisionase family DNA binding protein